MLEANRYQELAARTINEKLFPWQKEDHALKGMVSEVGELNGIYQKQYQGHTKDKHHLMSELGDLLWFIAEYCTAMNWELEDVMWHNIDKLRARYPDGFASEQSLHRKEGDI